MFLATTALTEFWEPAEELLFLGRWCLRRDRRTDWEGLRYQVLPCPWDDRERFYEAARYLDTCQERLMIRLGEYLNVIHRQSFSHRSWRILIGPWLLYTLHAAFDRYVHLRAAFDREPGLLTLVLDARAVQVPADTWGAVKALCDDASNLQLITDLLQGLGYSFPARLPTMAHAAPQARLRAGDRRRLAFQEGAGRILNRAGQALALLRGRRWQIGLCDLYCPRTMAWQLAWRTGCRAMPLEMSPGWSRALPAPVADCRRDGLAGLAGADEFERVFVRTLPHGFPSLYLEGFAQAREEVRRRFPASLPVIVSANAWYFHEPFKFFAADAAERRSRLIAVQHGGGYGLFRSVPMERHETLAADVFLAWGWANGAGPLRNAPHPNLSRLPAARRLTGRRRRADRILFVTVDFPRYLYRFHSTPVGSQAEDYHAWQVRFLEALPDRLRGHVRFRGYHDDYGHAVRARITERFPDLRWCEAGPLARQFPRARLVVIDHLGTTCLETLAANRPTVLFWDPGRWEVRQDAEAEVERLRRAGILWDAPETAAAHVAAVYENPLGWWGGGAVQQARRLFVERHARATPAWVEPWARLLQEELAVWRTG